MARAAAALEAKASLPFDVEPTPTDFNTANPGKTQLACGTSHCLMIYDLLLDDDVNRVFGVRFNAQGQRIDTPSLLFAKGEYIVAVGARDDEFLVVTSGNKTITTGPYRYYRVRGSDGTLLPGDVTAAMPTGMPYRIASTGLTWMLLYPTSTSADSELRLYDTNFQPIGAPVTFVDASPKLFDDLVPGAGQYLALNYGKFLRISETTGLPLDAAPVQYTAYLSLSQERAVYFNGVYEIIAGSGEQLYGWRVNAETGALLDPDDTFNETTGAKVIHTASNSLFSIPAGLDLDVFDGDVVASYFYVQGAVQAQRLDLTTGLAKGTAVTALGTVPVSALGDRAFQFHSVGSSAFLLGNSNLMRFGSVTASPYVASFTGNWQTAAVPSFDRMGPQVASNGNGYAVVFAVGSSSAPQGADIYVTRIDPNTGAYLDNPPKLVGSGEYPMITSNGTDYLVAWLSTADATTHGYTAVFSSSSGSLSTGVSHTISSNVLGFIPQFAFNGDYFVSTWSPLGARLDKTGHVLRADDVPSSDSAYYSLELDYDLGKPGPRVVADTSPTPDRRTFLVVGRSGSQSNPAVSAIRIRSATGKQLERTLVAEAHLDPFVATDGTNFLVVSRFDRSTNWDGVFVDPVSGLPVAGTEKQMAALAPSQTVTSVFFDGSTYNLVIRDGNPADHDDPVFLLRRYDKSLNRLAEEGTSLGTLLSGNFAARWDSSAVNLAPGRSMVTFDVIDTARAGVAIKGAFVATDGSTPAVTTGGSAGAGGVLLPGAAGTASLGIGGALGNFGGAAGAPANRGGSGGITASGTNSTNASGSGNIGYGAAAGRGAFGGVATYNAGAASIGAGGKLVGSSGSMIVSNAGMTTIGVGVAGQGVAEMGGAATGTPVTSNPAGSSHAAAGRNAAVGGQGQSTIANGVAGISSAAEGSSDGCLMCRVGTGSAPSSRLGWLLGLSAVVTLRRRSAKRGRR